MHLESGQKELRTKATSTKVPKGMNSSNPKCKGKQPIITKITTMLRMVTILHPQPRQVLQM